MEYVANRQIVSKTGQACEGTDRPTQRISDRAFHKGEVAAGGGMGSPEWRGSMAVLRFLVGIAPTGGVFPFLQKVSKGSASAKTADAKEVLEYLTSVMRGEREDEVLRFIGDGYQDTTTLQVPTKERLKAAELLGKRFGLFTEKVQMDISPVTIIDNIPKGDANA